MSSAAYKPPLLSTSPTYHLLQVQPWHSDSHEQILTMELMYYRRTMWWVWSMILPHMLRSVTFIHTHKYVLYWWHFSLILRYIRNFLPPGGCAHRGTSQCCEHPAFPPSHSHPSTPHRLRVQRAREHDRGEERAMCRS